MKIPLSWIGNLDNESSSMEENEKNPVSNCSFVHLERKLLGVHFRLEIIELMLTLQGAKIAQRTTSE